MLFDSLDILHFVHIPEYDHQVYIGGKLGWPSY